MQLFATYLLLHGHKLRPKEINCFQDMFLINTKIFTESKTQLEKYVALIERLCYILLNQRVEEKGQKSVIGNIELNLGIILAPRSG